jgi:cytochrome c oxidase accessory protein FixG
MTDTVHQPPIAQERVLSTLNEDGSRRWIRPRPANGKHLRQRRLVGWVLIGLFWTLPFIEIGGRPTILLDLARREFTFFGVTFLPSDTHLLMLLLLTVLIGIFLMTAIFGRVWCGWACPQTVYMELLFRPIERLIERRRPGGRPLLKHLVFIVVAFAVGNVFLSYFVSAETLLSWMKRSPLEHPAPFVVVALTSALMYFDFGWFREQMCTVACPYARLQSVLLDRKSLIVGYDRPRGEPRAKLALGSTGACIDCRACVASCPMGIDVRNGLQLECIACAQCADACDAIMDRVGRPRGLIRYGSQDELEQPKSLPKKYRRWRLMTYPVLFAIFGGALVLGLAGREIGRVTVLRPTGTPFTIASDGTISNQVRIKLQNSDRAERTFSLSLDAEGLMMIAPENPLTIRGNGALTTSVFLVGTPDRFREDSPEARIVVKESNGEFSKVISHRLIGPSPKEVR